VIDSDPEVLALARATLEPAGYRVICESDGEAALRLAAQDPPAVVVLDLHLPGAHGFELLERLRRIPAGRQAAVIVWNGTDLEEEDRQRLASLTQAVVHGGPTALLEELRRLAPQRPEEDPAEEGRHGG